MYIVLYLPFLHKPCCQKFNQITKNIQKKERHWQQTTDLSAKSAQGVAPAAVFQHRSPVAFCSNTHNLVLIPGALYTLPRTSLTWLAWSLTFSSLSLSVTWLSLTVLSLSYKTLSLSNHTVLSLLRGSLSLLLDFLSLESYSALSLSHIWHILLLGWTVQVVEKTFIFLIESFVHVGQVLRHLHNKHCMLFYMPQSPPHHHHTLHMAHSVCHAPNLALNAFWPPQQTLPAECPILSFNVTSPTQQTPGLLCLPAVCPVLSINVTSPTRHQVFHHSKADQLMQSQNHDNMLRITNQCRPVPDCSNSNRFFSHWTAET